MKEILARTIELYISRPGFFAELLVQHLRIAGTAIVTSMVLGVLLGILIYRKKGLANIVIGIVNIVYTIPSIALLGLLIPLSGVGDTTAIIALTVYALLPIVRSTYTGLCSIDASVLRAAVGMGSTQWQLLWRIELPLAFSVILSGIRNMVVMTISMCGIASFIGAGGIGVAIYRGITTYDMGMTVAGSVMIAALAFLMDYVIGRIERLVKKKWRLG